MTKLGWDRPGGCDWEGALAISAYPVRATNIGKVLYDLATGGLGNYAEALYLSWALIQVLSNCNFCPGYCDADQHNMGSAAHQICAARHGLKMLSPIRH